MQIKDKKTFFFCSNIFTIILVLLCLFYNHNIDLSKYHLINFYNFSNINQNKSRSVETLNAVEVRGGFSKTHVLSYSLFGNNWVRYGRAVEEVAKEASANKLYHNWTVRVYHDKYTMNAQYIKNLTKLYHNLELSNVSSLVGFGDMTNINGMVWRFLTVADATVNVTCVRDLDSKLLERESDAVKVWLDSGKLVHIMRDNPQHDVEILGGMWCYRNELNRPLGIKIANLSVTNSAHRDPDKQMEAPRGNDQSILGKFVWPLVHENAVIHDSYRCQSGMKGEPFPSKRFYLFKKNLTISFNII